MKPNSLVLAVNVALTCGALLVGAVTGVFSPRAATVTLQPVEISAVLRDTGTGWTVLNDATHQPEHVTGVEVVGTALKVTFDQSFTKVGAIAVSPDETFAPLYTAGASVGLPFAYVTMWNADGTMVTDPNTVVSATGNWWITGSMWKTA